MSDTFVLLVLIGYASISCKRYNNFIVMIMVPAFNKTSLFVYFLLPNLLLITWTTSWIRIEIVL